MRRIAIEDFTDLSETAFPQMRRDAPQIGECLIGVAMYVVMSKRKRTEQPAPDGALVIDGVAAVGIARVATRVTGFGRCRR
jgi:hypothetical protein